MGILGAVVWNAGEGRGFERLEFEWETRPNSEAKKGFFTASSMSRFVL